MILGRYPWLLRFGVTPRPETLQGRPIDIVEASLRLAVDAAESLLDTSTPVGPMLCCLQHAKALIPVPAGTVDWWYAAHSQCHASQHACSAGLGEPLQPQCWGSGSFRPALRA
ncbi:hypothetical protein [Streptomyces violens]|uniref:hypothetical protein n=1 Tax=Streptomyces violens TaxID=66377 RepID=UPI0006905A40|nr:hypothetical protein [Streptomyces violens]